MKTSPAAATAASASGHSLSAQQPSTMSRCSRTTAANAAAHSRLFWASLNRRTSTASARPRSFPVMNATPFTVGSICRSGCHSRRPSRRDSAQIHASTYRSPRMQDLMCPFCPHVRSSLDRPSGSCRRRPRPARFSATERYVPWSPASAGTRCPCACRKLCHQAIFMDHAPGAVAPEDAEVIQVGDAIW